MDNANITLQEGEVPMSDDEVMRFTQGVRRKYIAHLTSEGSSFPKDTKEQGLLLTALADMDRTALGNKRIQATELQSETDMQVAQVMAELSRRYGQSHPFRVDAEVGHIPEPNNNLLPIADAVPGETVVGTYTTDYDTLMLKPKTSVTDQADE